MVPLLWPRFALLALILSTVCPDLLAGQAAPSTPNPQPLEAARRLELTMWLGGAGGGPGGSLESVLQAAGFDDLRPGFKHGSGSPSLKSDDIGLGYSFDARIPLRRPLSLVVVFARTEPGGARGYRATPECCGDYLFLQNAVQTFAAVVAVGARGVHVGLGPALHRTRVREETYGQSGDTKSSRLGALLQVRATVPHGSRVFFGVKGEYRYIPVTTVGPFIPNRIADASDMSPLIGRIRFSHAFVGLGLGVRF